MKNKDEYPRIHNLPKKEQKPFSDWLHHQSRPYEREDVVHDRYYPWDYEQWKSEEPVLD